jgi:hypothetical protein
MVAETFFGFNADIGRTKTKPAGKEVRSVLNTSQTAATSNGNQEAANERFRSETNATDDITGSQARSAPYSPAAGKDFSSKNFTEERPSIPPEETPAASDYNVTTRLWKKALDRLSEDKSKKKILDKYKEIAMPELVNSGLAPNKASPPDMQRVEDWLKKSDSPSLKGGEVLDNVAKALSCAAQFLSPAAIEPHIGLVYAGLCILMQVSVQLF